jgi:hypothetical protein
MSAAPTISSISPSTGPTSGGTQVSIAGSGLSATTDVQFGGNSTPGILSTSDTLVVAVSPAGGTLGNVTLSVVTPNGTVPWPNGFDYEVSVTRIFPVSGSANGGLSVAITGSGFMQVYGVLFGDTPATSFITTNDNLITVTTPPSATTGAVPVTLQGLTGNSVYIELGGFTYVPAAATPVSTTTSAASTTTAAPATTPTTTTTPATMTTATPATTTTTAATPAATTTATPTTAASSATPAGTTAPASATGTAVVPSTTSSPSAATSGAASAPAPANYYPGGAMIVPGGQTGLGGSAGTGAGFGVGTLMAGGGGSAAASNLPYYVDPGLTAQLVQTLIGLVQSATSPDALESQNMILRRMALEGDVIGSRIPPPRNISEIGGYLNLLGTLKEKAMREQALAGILGVAGPAQPLGWITNTQALSMVAVSNDRPPVAAQPSFPLSVLVRSDFVAPVQSALKMLHSYGGTLPLVSPSVILLPPGGTGATIPYPTLFYVGRTMTIAPTAGLVNPAADPIALIPPGGAMTDYALASQVLNAATYQVPPADLEAVQCTPTTEQIVQLSQVSFVPIAPILATAGFYSPSPFPVPANSTVTNWAWLTNVTGLVAGQTELGDELSLLYRQDQIAGSAFAAMLTWTWDGSAFSP